MNNVFEINEPDNYFCAVVKYTISHSIMHIEARAVSDPADKLFIIFSPVEYFQGPFAWLGVDFQIAPSWETLEVLQRVERHEGGSPEALLETPYNLKLYTARTSQHHVQVITRNTRLYRTLKNPY